MFNRWPLAELQRVPRLSAAFIAGCAVVIVGCLATHRASPAASGQQVQADQVNRPFERIDPPVASAVDYEIRLSGNGHAMIVVEPNALNPEKRQARVWDVAAVKPLTGPLPLAWLDYGLDFDGKIAFTTDHKHVWVWDVTTSRLLWTKELNQTQSGGVAISPDGAEIVGISETDRSVKVWRVGSEQPRLSIRCTDAPSSVDFDPTGKRIAILAVLLHVYDAQTGRELFPGFIPYGFIYIFPNLRHYFDLTGQRFLELEFFGARVIDTATGKTLLRIESKYNIDGVSWSADSHKIVLLTLNKAAQVYDAGTGKLERTIARDDMSGFWVLRGGRWAICWFDKKPLEVWDLTTGQKVQALSGSQYCNPQPVGSTLVTKDTEGLVKVWQLRDGFK